MTTVLGVLVLIALFMLFPLVARERNSGGCATGGCWRKRLGFGCGRCAAEGPAARKTGADADGAPRGPASE